MYNLTFIFYTANATHLRAGAIEISLYQWRIHAGAQCCNLTLEKSGGPPYTIWFKIASILLGLIYY